LGEPQYSHNHVINPKTGYLENPAYAHDFDSERKEQFLRVYYKNCLRLYRTLDELGISPSTYDRHYHIDKLFKENVDKLKTRYADELEGVSRESALNPKSMIERIFQLKSLFPSKYGEAKGSGNTMVNLVFDGNMLGILKNRDRILETKEAPNEIYVTDFGASPLNGEGKDTQPTKHTDTERT